MDFDAERVAADLHEAGRTHMAMRVSRCWPAGFRSGMPEPLLDLADMDHAETECSPSLPGAADIAAMDRRFDWVRLCLPGATPVRIRHRLVMLRRSLQHPDTERHVYTLRQLAESLNCSHQHVSDLWDDGLDRIAGLVSRYGETLAALRARANPATLPAPCLDTLRRIRASVPAPARRVQAVA